MGRQRLSGVLWLIAGISSGFIAFYIVDALTLGVFIAGAAAGVLLGLGMLVRPGARYGTVSAVLGLAWLVAYGAVTLANLSAPIEELVSVIWVLAFGVAASAVALARGRSPVFG